MNDKQSNLFPMCLLIGGGIAALIYAITLLSAFFNADPQAWDFVRFAIGCLVAALGWVELKATENFNESFESE